MRTVILTTTKRNDIVDTRQYMFNVNHMKSLASRGAALTDFKVGENRYQVGVAIATVAGYVDGYAPGYRVSVTAVVENDKPVSKTVVLDVDKVLLAYAYSGNSSYAEVVMVDGTRLVVNTTLALLNTACNTVSGSGSAGGLAKAFGKVAAEAETPEVITFADPISGGAVTMANTNYIILVNGMDADGPVDVQVTSITTTGFTATVAADCTIYYAVFE